jgi:UDP-N-acetylmuramoyl-tripeptide--D-alanyl-D-alanine ligase
VGVYAKEQAIDKLFTLGVLSQNASEMFNGNGKHFSSLVQLLCQLTQVLDSANEKVTVLVKGSRSARMERVVEGIISHYNNALVDDREVS